MGASWECICFIARALGARDQQQTAYVTVSTLLFLLAPICEDSICPVRYSANIRAQGSMLSYT
jgi:glucose uptake protein GlcU